tara:strand:+ start:102 stop:401 length:300 start_codon:yes stop_codon:yes gene_type:complete
MDFQILDILGLAGLNSNEMIWMLFGLFGQLVFFSRWVIQWIASERNSKSIIPIPFWWCSLIGGIITFIYACHIGSFPFILAQFIGIIVYLRNIYLIKKA